MTPAFEMFPENTMKCNICSFWLENNKFPDDFPKEWRWCCGCLNIGAMILEKSFDEMMVIFHNSPHTMERIKGVNKLISVT